MEHHADAPALPLEPTLYQVKKTIVGQDGLLERMLVALLARGHLLVEGVPGLAKTMAIKTLARTIGGQFQRIQFTSDLVPADVVGTRLGMCGMEYFGHPWEFGPRKAKELMLTGDAIDVHEAHRLGMVSKVFPRDELGDRTLDMARRIAQVPTMAALLIKESVNQTVDNMGFYNSLQACFTLHQLNHSHWVGVREDKRATAGPENGVPDWRDAPPIVLAEKDTVRADR